ncbi:MAG TPA: hypothetical protein VKZ59_15715 [Acidobacteriota bacterium]|nr:hypothetical protein [Acidobacteriota bacterium]
MSYFAYKWIHLVGVFMILLSFGGLVVVHSLAPSNAGWRRLGAITNGIGLLVVLVAGFGLMARLGLGAQFPVWLLLKLLIWLLFGAAMMVASRKVELASTLWWLSLVLAGAAAYLAIYKPF